MPELPEVETVRSRLAEILPGKKIFQLDILKNKSFQGDKKQVVGQKIEAVKRRAKLIYIQLDNGLYLLIHLKMTGQLIYVNDEEKIGGGHPTSDWVKDLPSNHTRIIFYFHDKSKLFFNDMRIFGWIKVMTHQKLNKQLSKYGPDINNPNIDIKDIYRQLQRRTISIKQAIMINKIIAGIGNIYASEALFKAQINPTRSAKDLSLDEVKQLIKSAQEIISKAIKNKGTTFDGKYVDINGLAGNYQNKLKVYGQEGQKCPNCQGNIKKVKLGGRSTFYCPDCQH